MVLVSRGVAIRKSLSILKISRILTKIPWAAPYKSRYNTGGFGKIAPTLNVKLWHPVVVTDWWWRATPLEPDPLF
jgi:hypothetical protein